MKSLHCQEKGLELNIFTFKTKTKVWTIIFENSLLQFFIMTMDLVSAS